ncbi:MAG TPA: VOC family protein [Acidimicrobiales bacterium]|nr:VOC family protein [Acidimicrobiales bacterium]
MPEFTSYPAGVPCWVDLASPNVEETQAFYGAVFGWEAGEASEEGGGYFMFLKSGKPVAGCMPMMGEGQPPAWTTYVRVDDADATIEAARGAGATVFAGPMDVLDVGRMAVFADPTGAALGIWQPNQFPGAALANETGTFVWNELQTRDTAAAKEFYRAVFGWEGHDTPPEPMPYTEWKIGERTIGGMMSMPPMVPADVPANWLVYFGVDDCDGTVAKAESLGAKTMAPPMDIPAGRFAVLLDPHGAAIGVIRMS